MPVTTIWYHPMTSSNPTSHMFAIGAVRHLASTMLRCASSQLCSLNGSMHGWRAMSMAVGYFAPFRIARSVLTLENALAAHIKSARSAQAPLQLQFRCMSSSTSLARVPHVPNSRKRIPQLKDTLRKLMIKVHPDKFHRHPTAREVRRPCVLFHR